MAPTSVTIDRGIKSVTRGVPGPPGDLTEPFTSITFDTVNPDLPLAIAQMTWDKEEDTLQFRQNGTTLQIGQEVQWPVVNKTGADIANGTPVMAVGTTGATGRLNIAPMDGTDTDNVKLFGGLATEDIDDLANGKVSAFGKVRDIQTNGANYGETWLDEDVIYVSPTIVGALTNIEPIAGQVKVPCAFVVNAHVSAGVLAVRVTPIDEDLLVTPDQRDALDSAATPSASNPFATMGAISRELGITIDGAGQVILTGEKGIRPITYPMTITGWKLNADQAGDIVIDVLNNGVSITGATKPTLATQQKSTGTSSDWTKSLINNDEISFVVDSVSGIIRATLIITAIQTGT